MQSAVAKAVEAMFSPCITLRKSGNRLTYDLVRQYRLFRQFMDDAGLRTISLGEADYDKFLAAASDHGYSVEVLEPEE